MPSRRDRPEVCAIIRICTFHHIETTKDIQKQRSGEAARYSEEVMMANKAVYNENFTGYIQEGNSKEIQ